MDDFRRIKVEERGTIGAFGDIFAGVFGGRIGFVEAFAVCHDMRGVEVMNVEITSNIGRCIMDQVVYVAFETVDGV